MQHSFDIYIAEKYGVHAAIILNNLQHWIIKNKANEKHQHEGRTWTYNSIKALSQIFPYLSKKQIRAAIDKLVDGGVLMKGNFNDTPYDRTCWYAFVHEETLCPKRQMENPKKSNQIDQEGEPIPYINTDINQSLSKREKNVFKKIFPSLEDFSALLHKRILAAAQFLPEDAKLTNTKNYYIRIANWSSKHEGLKLNANGWIAEAFCWVEKDIRNGVLEKVKPVKRTVKSTVANQYEELLQKEIT